MVLYRSGDHVDISFQPCAIHSPWIPIPGTTVEREILRADLQDLAILFQANTRSQFDRVPQVVGLNVPPPAKLVKPSAVNACNRAAYSNDRRLGRGLCSCFRLVQRKSYTLRQGCLIIQPTPAPCVARRLSESQEFETLVLQGTAHHTRACASQIDTDRES